MDLARIIQEAKSLPDEALKREITSPTGMMPGYLAMSELSDRQALRSGSKGPAKRPSMAEEMLGAKQGFAQGGLVGSINPFLAYLEQRVGQPLVDAQDQASGLTPLAMPNPPAGLQAPDPLMAPQMPGAPSAPPRYSQGGLASLLRR